MIIDTVALLLTGMIVGAVLVRYGIGLGAKIIYKTREDLPLNGETAEPTEQDYTGE